MHEIIASPWRGNSALNIGVPRKDIHPLNPAIPRGAKREANGNPQEDPGKTEYAETPTQTLQFRNIFMHAAPNNPWKNIMDGIQDMCEC